MDFLFYFIENLTSQYTYYYFDNIPILAIFNIGFLIVVGISVFVLPKYQEVVYPDYDRAYLDAAKFYISELALDASQFESQLSAMVNKYTTVDATRLKLFEIPRLSRDLATKDNFDLAINALKVIDTLLIKVSLEELPSVIPVYMERSPNITSANINALLNHRELLLRILFYFFKDQPNVDEYTLQLLVSISKDSKSTAGLRRFACQLFTMNALQRTNNDNLLSSGAFNVIKYYYDKKIDGKEGIAILTMAEFYDKSMNQNNFPNLSAKEYIETSILFRQYNILKIFFNAVTFILTFIFCIVFLFDFVTSSFYALVLGTDVILYLFPKEELKYFVFVVMNFTLTKYWVLISITKNYALKRLVQAHISNKTMFVPIKYTDEQLFYMIPEVSDSANVKQS